MMIIARLFSSIKSNKIWLMSSMHCMKSLSIIKQFKTQNWSSRLFCGCSGLLFLQKNPHSILKPNMMQYCTFAKIYCQGGFSLMRPLRQCMSWLSKTLQKYNKSCTQLSTTWSHNKQAKVHTYKASCTW